MKKNILYFLSIGLLLFASCNNSKKSDKQQQDSIPQVSMNNPEEIQQISEVISRFARAYLSQDNDKINALINPETGIAIIHRPGVADTYTLVDSIDFKNPVPAHYAYETFQNDQVLTFAPIPEFDCGKDKWTKIGFFCDTTASTTHKPLETIAKFLAEFEDVKFDEAKKKEIEALENGAYRVILAQEKNSLIFHVKKFKNGWFVTILDRAYGSCDA